LSRKSDDLQIRFVASIDEIDAQAWNELVGTESPFLRHEFLLALEQSGCTSRATGWQPHHLVASSASGKSPNKSVLKVAVPLYIKYNSYGEYVFDWSWADAYRSNGLDYYPKLLTAIPFTPSTSSRILHQDCFKLQELVESLSQAIITEAQKLGASSWHVLFPTIEESEALVRAYISQRRGCQFQWFNRGYTSFEDFLSRLSSRKRKNLRKEREHIIEQGIHFETVEGPDISESQWKHFYVFYQSTYLVRGREGYLNQDFFLQTGRTMPENLVMILAKTDQQIIAGALFFKDDSRLYGRYWGSLEDYQFLHFETCFYQGIDYCITNSLSQFDAGAQGEHKIQRGFEPQVTYSNHWIDSEVFAGAIKEFLQRESSYIDSYMNEAEKLLPFKKSD